MSEFSQSLHLRGDGQDEAVAMLVAARVRGVVMPPMNGWVTLLPELSWDASRLDRVIDAPRTPLLLHWDYAEDHGLGVKVYQGDALAAELAISWETDAPSRFDREDFIHLGLLNASGADAIEQWLTRRTAGYDAAVALGLPHYRWAKFDRALRAFEDGRLPDATFVDADGTTHHGEPAPSPEPTAPPDLRRIARAVIATWSDAHLIAIDGEPSAALVSALAALLATQPSPSALEQFALHHPGIAEVFGTKQTLAAAAMLATRKLTPIAVRGRA